MITNYKKISFSLENSLNFGTSMVPNFFFIDKKKNHDEIYLW